MKKKSTTNRTNSRRRAKIRLRLFVVLSILNIALLVGTLLMLPTAFQSTDKETGKSKEWLAVESISVEGNTRYDDEAIIGVSGIEIGQSVFSVNKRTAAKNIRKAFAYAEAVTVDISLKRHVTLKITEAEELGAVYVGGKWVVVSRQGRGLMHLPVESERPFRRLYLKGANVLSDKLGETVLEKHDLAIALELCDAMAANGLVGVGEIDLSDRGDIRLNWKNQITIALGNDSNLTYEVAAAVSAIPKVLSRHGDTATGLLNLSQYSDETVTSPVIVFTPSSLLNADKEPEKTPDESGEGVQTTATTATTTRARQGG